MNAYTKVAFIAWLRQWVVEIEAHWADGVKKRTEMLQLGKV